VLSASGTAFDLSGILNDGKAMLEEIDHRGRVSGYFDVHLSRSNCRGEWWSTTYDRAIPVYFIASRIVQLKTFAPEILVIDGMLSGHKTNMILTKETPDVVSATVTFGDKLLNGVGACADRPCSQLTCPVSSSDDTYATVSVDLTSPGICSFSLATENKGSLTGFGKVTRIFPVKQTAIDGYSLLIDCAYPVTGHGAFDAWLQQQFDSWVSTVQPAGSIPLEQLRPADRWSTRGYAWIDMYMFNDVLASGSITSFSIADSTYRRTAFIYDLHDAIPIGMDDLVRKGVDLTNNILNRADEIASGAEDTGYPEAALPLRHISMGFHGFVVQSDFDQVYGEKVILVPYESVAHMMRKNVLTNSVLP
jgi:hypothetical protein